MDQQCNQLLRICLVATIPHPLVVFMGPHIRALSQHYHITIATNGSVGALGSADVLAPLLGEHVSYVNIPIAREISPLADLLALFALWRLLRREKIQIIHSNTPKAGLLGMIAGMLAGVSVRIHWFTGQVWATRKGFERWLLKASDRLLATCATHLLADSLSQAEFLVSEGVVQPSQVTVLGEGSVCGVDTDRFQPSPDIRSRIRANYGIADTDCIALYLGRLKLDKGIPELASAFLIAAQQCPDLHLLLVGPDEGGMREVVGQIIRDVSDRVHFVGFTTEPEAFMAAADYFVLPSHREGFGSSVIEAAACGIPTIGSQIYGLTDAIIDGRTGLLIPVGNVSAIADAMIKLTTDKDFRLYLGKQALKRINSDFNQTILINALLSYYTKALCLSR